ncbi:hypothetical protein ACFQY0_16415 [Haloferula chungangensis]|uniref:Uncharacterized protein n=1 Tax=Haloferula chungangensis TaxID=1048331 RepID=A0ABW2LDA3_9BACT
MIIMQDRRKFLGTLSSGYAGLALAGAGYFGSSRSSAADTGASDFATLTRKLLTDWCDGMLAQQIDDPDDSIRHGGLTCPSCDFIHGRCWEAVYPFLHLAKVSGDKKYLDAGIKLFDWSKNVSGADGRWTNDLNPKSWHGTSIFGAIALAEAIHYHGDLLSDEQLIAWKKRLDQAAGGYLWKDFVSLNFTNVNYGFTAVYGFDLLGRVLGEQKYIDRSRELAKGVKDYFTEPNKLLFGEGKPYNNRSDRGLLPVDLGYNVEESLNGVVLYALHHKDEELLKLLQSSLEGHLEFMLADGTWDNSWGTRQFKWTCWGSRTSDGCQPGFSMMAGRNPAFGSAAFRNTELLARCTANGLIHGGPHYVSHGIKPCIHHTFAHAKVLAFVQDNLKSLPPIDTAASLPRELAKGVKHFPEIAVWLAAQGPWRGTISAYDSIYRTKGDPDYIQQATGGSLAVLFHNKLGMIFAASMAKYIEVEPLNQQPNPDEDFALTPRIETRIKDKWFTNLYDLKADVSHREEAGTITFDVATSLRDEDRNVPQGEVSRFDLRYSFEDEKVTITAKSSDGAIAGSTTTLVLPVISPTGEKVRQVSATRIEISKPEGTLIVESTVPLSIRKSKKDRVFNMVPGCEAVPILAHLPSNDEMKVRCTISLAP